MNLGCWESKTAGYGLLSNVKERQIDGFRKNDISVHIQHAFHAHNIADKINSGMNIVYYYKFLAHL